MGLKPTWGRVSRYGVLALAESLDHIGPMTRSAADAGIMLRAIAGLDPNDPTSLRLHVVPTDADTQAQPASGQYIHRRRLLGNQRRLSLEQNENPSGHLNFSVSPVR